MYLVSPIEENNKSLVSLPPSAPVGQFKIGAFRGSESRLVFEVKINNASAATLLPICIPSNLQFTKTRSILAEPASYLRLP